MVGALRAEGIDASILSSDDDNGERLDVPVHGWIDYQGLPTYFIPRVRSRQHTLIGYTFAPGFPKWIRQNCRNYDFIHIHTTFSFPAQSVMTGARKAKIPYAVRPLGQLCRWSMKQRSLIKRIQLALVTRRNLNHAAFLHVTSQLEAHETSELGLFSPCKVLPHGIDLPPQIPNARLMLRSRLGLPADRLIVVFMGRFHPKKGVDLLLQACQQNLSLDFDIILAGVGDDAYVMNLKQQTVRLGLQSRVHWYGFVSGEDKWCLLQGSDLFVLPSYSENFGIAVLEAIACGLPVVVSDQVALAEHVQSEDLGRVVPIDVQSIALAIGELIQANDFRSGVKGRGTKLVCEQFSWSAAARRLIAAYSECISAATAST